MAADICGVEPVDAEGRERTCCSDHREPHAGKQLGVHGREQGEHRGLRLVDDPRRDIAPALHVSQDEDSVRERVQVQRDHHLVELERLRGGLGGAQLEALLHQVQLQLVLVDKDVASRELGGKGRAVPKRGRLAMAVFRCAARGLVFFPVLALAVLVAVVRLQALGALESSCEPKSISMS